MPTRDEIRRREAIDVGDVDNDGAPDYMYPGILNGPSGSRYQLWCYSNNNHPTFYVITDKGQFVHRCPFPDRVKGSRPGQNDFGFKPGPPPIYRGCTLDPGTLRKICYERIGDGKLVITVYQCTHKERDKDGKWVFSGCRPIRRQEIDPPTDAKELPWPEEIPAIETGKDNDK